MAWTDLTDAESGDILTAEQLNALRDNPIAIAQGLDGAPRVLQKKVFNSVVRTPSTNRQYFDEEFIREDVMTWSPLFYYIFSFVRNEDNEDETNTINSNRILRLLSTGTEAVFDAWAGEQYRIGIRRLPNQVNFSPNTEYRIGINLWGFELANMA